eukprot:1824451-Rhodomonas_salina.2
MLLPACHGHLRRLLKSTTLLGQRYAAKSNAQQLYLWSKSPGETKLRWSRVFDFAMLLPRA